MKKDMSTKQVIKYTDNQVSRLQNDFRLAVRDRTQISTDPLPFKTESKYDDLISALNNVRRKAVHENKVGTPSAKRHYTDKQSLHRNIHNLYQSKQKMHTHELDKIHNTPLKRNPKRTTHNHISTKSLNEKHFKTSRQNTKHIDRGQGIE